MGKQANYTTEEQELYDHVMSVNDISQATEAKLRKSQPEIGKDVLIGRKNTIIAKAKVDRAK